MMDNDKAQDLEQLLAANRRAWSKLGARPGPGPGRPVIEGMAARVEHTLLRADASRKQVEQLCREAREHRFRSVCVLPRDVAACRELLEGSGVLVVTVVDFPLAGGGAAGAAAEAARVVAAGAREVDMVVDLRALGDGDPASARDGVAGVVEAARGMPVKVILETGHLDPEGVAAGCAAAEAGGAAMVKTSTGYGPRGASLEDVRAMRACVGERLGVKASGGIRDRGWAERLVEAGADLFGTSSGPACVAAD